MRRFVFGAFCSLKKNERRGKGKGRRIGKRKPVPMRDWRNNDGEFDPGSERTLAARFKHASRTVYGASVL